MAQIVELIIAYDRVGDGTQENPTRICTELYTKQGQLVARYDPVTQEHLFYPGEIKTMENLVHKAFQGEE